MPGRPLLGDGVSVVRSTAAARLSFVTNPPALQSLSRIPESPLPDSLICRLRRQLTLSSRFVS
eukprot:scaffold62076_cov81-Phaeocystis_antarctica.AAC.1